MEKIEREKYHVSISTEFEAQKILGDVYELQKTIDTFANIGELHPNGIDKGYTVVGTFANPPTIGERFIIRGSRLTEYLNTSPVIEIVSETEFKTENSTYTLIKVKSSEFE